MYKHLVHVLLWMQHSKYNRWNQTEKLCWDNFTGINCSCKLLQMNCHRQQLLLWAKSHNGCAEANAYANFSTCSNLQSGFTVMVLGMANQILGHFMYCTVFTISNFNTVDEFPMEKHHSYKNVTLISLKDDHGIL